MAVSRKCEDCFQVKRCSAYPTDDQRVTLVYLCKPCARTLGYRASQPTPAAAAR